MKKILVIRFSSIGDIVLTGPVYKSIKAYRKDIHLTALTKAEYAPLLESNPSIDEVMTFDKKESLLLLIFKLRGKKFDLILDLHDSLRSFLIRVLLCIPSFSIKKEHRRRRSLLIQNNRGTRPWKRVLQKYLETAIDAGLSDPQSADAPSPWFPLSQQIVSTVKNKFLLSFKKKSYIAISPEARWKTKKWDKYRTLIETLISAHKKNVIILGQDPYPWPKNPRILNLTGKLTLMESAAILSLSECFIGNDTGLMHIADGLNKKAITIWGPTVREFGFAPINRNIKLIEIHQLTCRPCSLHGTDKCPQVHFKCMKLITVEDVIDELELLKII